VTLYLDGTTFHLFERGGLTELVEISTSVDAGPVSGPRPVDATHSTEPSGFAFGAIRSSTGSTAQPPEEGGYGIEKTLESEPAPE